MPVKSLYDAPLAFFDGGSGDAAGYVSVAQKFGVPLALTAASDADVPHLRELAARANVDVTIAGAPGTNGVDEIVLASGSLDELRAACATAASTKIPFVVALRVNDGGTLGDGSAIAVAVETLDADPAARPWNFMLDCADAAHADAACEALFRAAPTLAHRVVGVRSERAGDALYECAQRFGLHVVGTLGSASADDLAALAQRTR